MDLFQPETGKVQDNLLKSLPPDKLLILWESAEALTSSELYERRIGFTRLIEFDAIRQSPLVAYLIATKIIEPDIALRALVVNVLAEIIAPKNQNRQTSEYVRLTIVNYLSQVDIREVMGLLELANADSDSVEPVKILFCATSCAGRLLMDIAQYRELAMPVRQRAVHYIGQVGYLEALPALERLLKRYKSRPEAYPLDADVARMVRLIEAAIDQLKSP